MLDITKDQFIARIATLPKDLQEAIAAPETLEQLEKLAGTYQLDVVHIGLLHRLTVKLLAGVIAPREFVTLITEDLGIEQATSMLIAQDINRDIFSKVKDSLKSITAETAEVVAKPSIVSPYTSPAVEKNVATQQQETVKPASVAESPVVEEKVEVTPTIPTAPEEVITPKQEQIRDITPPMVSRIMTNEVVNSASAVKPNGQVVPAETKVANILESKLGGAFSIKKNDSYPQPITTPPVQTAQKEQRVATPEQLATPLIAVVVPASASAPLIPPPVLPKQ